MAVNLNQMISFMGVILANQLTDEQMRIMINAAEVEEVDSRSWARLKTEEVFNSFGIYTQGTVAVVQASSLVTGTGTGWTTAMVGMRFRAGTGVGSGGPSTQYAPIRIASVSSSTTLNLGTPYPLPSASNMGYQIFPEFYSIPGLKRVIGVRQQIPLRRRTHEYFNFIDPYRSNSSSPAVMWAPFGHDQNGNAQIEIWPVDTATEGYTAYGVKDHVDLRNPQDLPLLPSSVLMNKAIVKCCEALFALSGDKKWEGVAARFLNYYTIELEKAIEGDREEYGVIEQVLEQRYSDSASGNFAPGIDFIYNKDWIG